MRNLIALLTCLLFAFTGCAGLHDGPTSDIPEEGHGSRAFSEGGYGGGGGGRFHSGPPRSSQRSRNFSSTEGYGDGYQRNQFGGFPGSPLGNPTPLGSGQP